MKLRWPRDEEWLLVTIIVVGLISIVLFAYAGYLEATAPLPPAEGS